MHWGVHLEVFGIVACDAREGEDTRRRRLLRARIAKAFKYIFASNVQKGVMGMTETSGNICPILIVVASCLACFFCRESKGFDR